MCWVLYLNPLTLSDKSPRQGTGEQTLKNCLHLIWPGGEEEAERASTSFYQMGEPAYRLEAAAGRLTSFCGNSWGKEDRDQAYA